MAFGLPKAALDVLLLYPLNRLWNAGGEWEKILAGDDDALILAQMLLHRRLLGRVVARDATPPRLYRSLLNNEMKF